MASCKWALRPEAEERHDWHFPHYLEAWRWLIPSMGISAILVGREPKAESEEAVWMSIHTVH